MDIDMSASDAVMIYSGRPGHFKLIYRMFIPLESRKISKRIDGINTTIYELRCATTEGKSVQDVLPPSIHPDTGEAYYWGGLGSFDKLPTIPNGLLNHWNNLRRQREVDPTPLEEAVAHMDSWEDITKALNYINATKKAANKKAAKKSPAKATKAPAKKAKR